MMLPRFFAILAVLTLAACSSAPLRYYTLVDGGAPVPAADTGSAPRMPFVLTRVGIPVQVDQPQLVLRDGPQRIDLLESDRWIAPLGDEVRAALSADLARDLPGRDVTGLAEASGTALGVKLDLRRFDSVPGVQAAIEAAWTLHLPRGDDKAAAVLSCSTGITEPVAAATGPGYDALVQAHQRALGKLAAAIAGAAQALAGSGQAVCP
jgi:uncharacterized lipoprotein YmbA